MHPAHRDNEPRHMGIQTLFSRHCTLLAIPAQSWHGFRILLVGGPMGMDLRHNGECECLFQPFAWRLPA